MRTFGDLQRWLARYGLSAYYDLLLDNRIDLDILPELTESDLQQIGLPVGDRKRLIKAARALVEEPPPDSAETGRTSRLREMRGATDATGDQTAFPTQGRIRHVTLVFADVVGSTDLSETLDYEDYSSFIYTYHRICCEIVDSFSGLVARYVGDGVLAYFGYPRAIENHAERAVEAGLEIVRRVPVELGHYTDRPMTRVGIASGRAFVDELTEPTVGATDVVHGRAPNLAARVQAAAAPNTVVTTDETCALLGAHFECTPLGPHRLKGFTQKIRLSRIDGQRPAATRYHAQSGRARPPLIGRDEECDFLMKRWRTASRDQGRTVAIAGEAGVGKSRLVESVLERIEEGGARVLRFQCAPDRRRSAFHPVIDHIGQAAGIQRGDSDATKHAKLRPLVEHTFADAESMLPYFAWLLQITPAITRAVTDMPAQEVKERVKDILSTYLNQLAIDRPLACLVEDLHWIDASSEEFLQDFIAVVPHHPILLLFTTREYEPAWLNQPSVSLLTVNRLDRTDSLQVVRGLTGASIERRIADRICRVAEGVPLYLEELTRSWLDDAACRDPTGGHDNDRTEPPEADRLPATFSEVLTARLDAIAAQNSLVSVCAAIGRTFSVDILAQVTELPRDEITTRIDELVRQMIIVAYRADGDAVYYFRHNLIQEAAYAMLPKSRQRRLNARIAAVLCNAAPDYATRNPEVLAGHYREADMPVRARESYAEAAERAIQRSGYIEAIGHLHAALAENEKITDTQDRAETEIRLRERLVIPLEARFWGSRDIADNLDRLFALQTEYGTPRDLFAVVHGLYGTHIIAGKAADARTYADRMREIAEEQDDDVLRLMHRHANGMCAFVSGRFAEAVEFYNDAMALCDSVPRADVKKYYLADMRLVDQCMQAWAHALGGFASDRLPEIISGAANAVETTAEDFSQAYGLSILASVYQAVGRPDAAADYAGRAHTMSLAHRFRYWEAWSLIVYGWALAARGGAADGVQALETGLAKYVATGARQITGYARTLLADAYLYAGRLDEARATLDTVDADFDLVQAAFHVPILERVRRALRDAGADAGDPPAEDPAGER